MDEVAEDRVFDRRAGARTVYVAGSIGVAAVDVSGGQVGRFRLDRDCEARDLAAGRGALAGVLAVATAEDVLVRLEAGYVATGFGPAVAVGVDEGDLLAAGPDGELGRVVDAAAELAGVSGGGDGAGGADGGDGAPVEGALEWLAVADVDGAVRAIDGPLVGASDGVYRFTVDAIVDVGLDDVRDVSARGVPLAATGDGLYRLGNGWLDELPGAFDAVAGEEASGEGARGAGRLARAHAATGESLYEYDPGDDAGGGPDAGAWRERAVPAPVVDVAHGERTYAVTADGTLLVDRGDDWARRTIGLPDPTALAAPAD